jgi:hypothetical protein
MFENALAALQAHNLSAALSALEQAATADGHVGATARWARRAILRGMTTKETDRVIDALRWALEREDRAA